MIGIIVDPPDREWVEEFFELFKTPWEYWRPEGRYQALIVAGSEPPSGLVARLVLIYSSKEAAWDQQQQLKPAAQRHSTALGGADDPLPIYGRCVLWPAAEGSELFEPTTGLCADRVIQEGSGSTLIRVGYDLFGELRHLISVGQPPQYAGVPTLERHIAYLQNQLRRHKVGWVEIPPVPAGYRLMACLTHDVDHPRIGLHRFDVTMVGFLYRALLGSVVDLARGRGSIGKILSNWLAAGRLPFVYLGVAKDFWTTFAEYHRLEGERGSTFFVIPFKNRPGTNMSGQVQSRRGSGYEPADINEHLDRLAAHGREIALHGLDAWRDSASGREEQGKVAGYKRNGSETGIRMHWLYFDQDAPRKLEEAGFSYDSTVGYNQTVGFRAGTAQVYRPPGAKHLLELPLHIMDTALFYPSYLDATPATAQKLTERIIAQVEKFGGAVVINWHDRSLAPERLWGETFTELLATLTRHEAWFPTAGAAVSWFRKRRESSIHDVQWDAHGVRVKASAGPNRGRSSPALRLRVHRPGPSAATLGADYIERTFTDEFDARIAWE